MFKNSLLSLRYRFLDSWFVAASHFESWLHLGAGPPRLAISPPYSGTSRMVDKPVMVSFLLSSKTSSVRDLNTSGESAYTHLLNCEWIYLRKIKANTTQHERNKCCIETSDGMWRCQNSCYFVESGAYSTYSYSCCMRNPYACMQHGPTTASTSPSFNCFLGQAVIFSANHIPQIEVQTGKGAVQL